MEPNKNLLNQKYFHPKDYPQLPPYHGPRPQIPHMYHYDQNIVLPANTQYSIQDSNFQNTEKTKRHRRGKNEINDRNYRCPDCDKCYLSGPALTTHRKTKHGYGINGEKRARGRPRKDCINENIEINPQNNFLYFFGEEHRKLGENQDYVNLDIIKENIKIIFKQCKESVFNDIDNVEKYNFYKLIEDNWDKENPEFEQECYSGINMNLNMNINMNMNLPMKENININNKIQSYNLDCIFFFYLKEFYKYVNDKYFWFLLKFIILFRECINKSRKDLIKKENENENKEYSQLYNAEIVPEICNEFLLDFMEPYDYYGMNKDELIELIQHFCYWLGIKQFTQLQISLINK